MSDLPLSEQIAEVKRELRMREAVYPIWVDGGRQSQALATQRLAALRAVLDTLRGVALTRQGGLDV